MHSVSAQRVPFLAIGDTFDSVGDHKAGTEYGPTEAGKSSPFLQLHTISNGIRRPLLNLIGTQVKPDS